MTRPFIIEDSIVDGDELAQVVGALQEVLEDIPTGLGITALIALAVHMQNPDLDGGQLSALTFDVSRYICMQLVGNDIPKEKMN